MVLAWENLQRFLWCWPSFCCCCIFIWFPGYFVMSPALHPGFSDPWRSPPALSSTPTTLDYLFFFIYRERYCFEWAFFRRFLLYTPCWQFGITSFYQGFAGSRQLLSWKLQGFILILKTQTQLLYLFYSQQFTIFYTS